MTADCHLCVSQVQKNVKAAAERHAAAVLTCKHLTEDIAAARLHKLDLDITNSFARPNVVNDTTVASEAVEEGPKALQVNCFLAQ